MRNALALPSVASLVVRTRCQKKDYARHKHSCKVFKELKWVGWDCPTLSQDDPAIQIGYKGPIPTIGAPRKS